MTAILNRSGDGLEVTPRFTGMKVTQWRVIKSEWTKFRSLRSSLITLLVAMVLTVGLGALISGVVAANWDHATANDRGNFHALDVSLSGVGIAQLAIGVLGVLLLSGEYATGMIRSSLTAVPKRLTVLWAKLSLFAGVVGIVSIISTFAAFFIGQSLLSSKHIETTISSPDVLRMVVGAGVYMMLIGIIGMALGGLLRNTAAGISSLVAIIFVIPPVMGLLPSSWSDRIGPYLPSNAGQTFWTHMSGKHLSALSGFVVLCLWAAVAVAACAYRMKRSDA